MGFSQGYRSARRPPLFNHEPRLRGLRRAGPRRTGILFYLLARRQDAGTQANRSARLHHQNRDHQDQDHQDKMNPSVKLWNTRICRRQVGARARPQVRRRRPKHRRPDAQVSRVRVRPMIRVGSVPLSSARVNRPHGRALRLRRRLRQAGAPPGERPSVAPGTACVGRVPPSSMPRVTRGAREC